MENLPININIFVQELGAKTVEILLLRNEIQRLQERIQELEKTTNASE